MTTVDVVYRFAELPGERSVQALSAVREVYGIRRVDVDARAHTVTVEYDSSRLTEALIYQFLRRAGVEIAERVQRYAVPPPAQPAV